MVLNLQSCYLQSFKILETVVKKNQCSAGLVFHWYETCTLSRAHNELKVNTYQGCPCIVLGEYGNRDAYFNNNRQQGVAAVGTGLWIWIDITSCAPNGSFCSVTQNEPAISVQHKDFTQRKLLCELTSRQHIHIRLSTQKALIYIKTSRHSFPKCPSCWQHFISIIGMC